MQMLCHFGRFGGLVLPRARCFEPNAFHTTHLLFYLFLGSDLATALRGRSRAIIFGQTLSRTLPSNSLGALREFHLKQTRQGTHIRERSGFPHAVSCIGLVRAPQTNWIEFPFSSVDLESFSPYVFGFRNELYIHDVSADEAFASYHI